VGRPDVQGFAGSLQGAKARKGVLMSTGSISQEAREYVRSIETRIVLIDGDELVGLMINHGVGVSTVENYRIQRVDEDYFEEE